MKTGLLVNLILIFHTKSMLARGNSHRGVQRKLSPEPDLNVFGRSQKIPISLADECVTNLMLEDKQKNATAKNWTCRMLNKKSVNSSWLCSCSYQYKCFENKKFYFSLEYGKHLRSMNMLNFVNKGAEYQCESYLVYKTRKSWSCTIELEPSYVNNESYCDCYHEKMCIYNLFVESYSELSDD